MKLLSTLARILPPLWLGMVAAIAMEAVLKFRAPGITRELGLGIGKLVFTALNRCELVIAVILLAAVIFAVRSMAARIVFGGVAVILLLQTFWLMPPLIERIDLITSGQQPPESRIHVVYVTFEMLKLFLLLVLSFLVNWTGTQAEGTV